MRRMLRLSPFIALFVTGCVVEEQRSEPTKYYLEGSQDLAARYRAKAAAAREKPDAPASHWFLGNYHLLLDIERDIVKAEAEFNILKNMMPEKPEPYYGLGMCAEAKNNLDAAILLYETAIDKDAAFADAYRALARAYEKKGDAEKSKLFMDKFQGVRMAEDYLRSRPSPLDHPEIEEDATPHDENGN